MVEKATSLFLIEISWALDPVMETTADEKLLFIVVGVSHLSSPIIAISLLYVINSDLR